MDMLGKIENIYIHFCIIKNMSWFKYDCRFCDETFSIDIFGSHLFDAHYNDINGTIMIKKGRVHLCGVTNKYEDMIMCAACGFAVKTQAIFDKHLATKGEDHRRLHLENIRVMKGSDFEGKLNFSLDDYELKIEEDSDSEEEEKIQIGKRGRIQDIEECHLEPQPKRRRLNEPEDKFNKVHGDLLQVYNEWNEERRRLRQEIEELRRKNNESNKRHEDAIKLLLNK